MNKTDNHIIFSVNRTALFLALFYAFSTRSIIGPMIFWGNNLLFYYGVLYLSLFLCFFESIKSYTYSVYFYIQIAILFFIVTEGLIRMGDLHSLLYYGIAFLIPFSLKTDIKSKKNVPYSLSLIGVILFIGCFYNYFFPDTYQRVIFPLFTVESQSNIEWQLGFETFFPGFTSQVGYTSFYLSIVFGAVFCFRNIIFKKLTVPLFICLLFALILTGKRGPFLFLFLTLIIVYFLENPENNRFVKVAYILFIALFLYILLFFLLQYADIESLSRIYSAFYDLIKTGTIEDLGRQQLREHAWNVFEENPLVGIGWGNFIKSGTTRNTYVHNIYLQLLCECGILGFVYFVFFFVEQLIITIKKYNHLPIDGLERSWLLFSFFIQLYFLLYGFTGNPLYDIEETILYFFSIGIANLSIQSSNSSFYQNEIELISKQQEIV